MAKIKILLSGVGAELALGNYWAKDATIYNDWSEFYHYNDLIHESQLLVDHIEEMIITEDNIVVYQGKIPASQFQAQKSVGLIFEEHSLYLRTECAEKAIFQCELETDNFDRTKLVFETQEYDLLFKVGNSFLAKLLYEDKNVAIEWMSAKSIGNICMLCQFENGFLVPVYDAVNKLEAK